MHTLFNAYVTHTYTLKVENFAGTKFRGFRGFRGSTAKFNTRETFNIAHPRNLIHAKFFHIGYPRNLIPAKVFEIGYPTNLMPPKISLLR